MTERETVQVKLIDMAYGGEAVGRLGNQVVFASPGIPGETVDVEVISRKKDFLRGHVSRVVKPSPDRIQPRCEYFGSCGGCQWQHVEYERQLDLKRRIVIDQLRRVGKFSGAEVRPTIGFEPAWHYRNHARFSVGSDGDIGFARASSHDILSVGRCHLLHPTINEVLAQMQGVPRTGGGHPQITVRCGVHTGQILISPKLDLEGISLRSGGTHLTEELLGVSFRISAASFFQVNTPLAEVMARTILEQLDPSPDDTVVDAFCGVGTFGLLLAGRVRNVVGIEDSEGALKDAAYNARGVDNVRFVRATTEQALPQVLERDALVILDPPRQGCHPRVVEALGRQRPRRVVYVSCDPATLARDLRLLAGQGLKLQHIQPIDVFPQTYHIECVALLADAQEQRQ